mgnify:CR=1 FL=1
MNGEKILEQMYLEFPLKPEHVHDFIDLCNSAIGFPLSKKQPGFISAEWMISTSEDGITCLHLWEKWESQGHFTAYMQTPEREKGSKFELSLSDWGAGKTKVYWGIVRSV